MESKLNVERWQTARPQWHYTPALWFYFRMVEVAMLDAAMTAHDHIREVKTPTDEALLARDWIARSELLPPHSEPGFVSFVECCTRLGLNPDVERAALLEDIDKGADFDTDEAWERLEVLSASEPKDDDEPLFESFRVVPALDQMTMFAA